MNECVNMLFFLKHQVTGCRMSKWLNKRKCDLMHERTVVYLGLPAGDKLSERI